METKRKVVAAGMIATGLLGVRGYAAQHPKSYSPPYVPEAVSFFAPQAQPAPWRPKAYRSDYVPEAGGTAPSEEARVVPRARPKSYRADFVPTRETAYMPVDAVLVRWPVRAEQAARVLIEKYGMPDESGSRALVWISRGPWKRIIARGAMVESPFPARHYDFDEFVVRYEVPREKFAELTRLGVNLTYNQTRGELSSTEESEAMSFLSLNVAHEVASGRRDAAEARRFMADTAEISLAGKSSPYMERLLFVP